MNKFFMIILCICLLTTAFAGCASNPEASPSIGSSQTAQTGGPSSGASPTATSTSGVSDNTGTESAGTTTGTATSTVPPTSEVSTTTTPPTATKPTPSKEDNMLFDFEDGNANIFSQDDLSKYHISSSPQSISSENTDTGKGFKIELGEDSSRSCQGLTGDVPSASFDNYAKYKYIRLWVHNKGKAPLSVGVILYGRDGTIGSMNSSKAVVTRCDGVVVTTEADNSAGSGLDHVKLPAGFSGWIALPLAESTLDHWGNPLLTDLAQVYRMKLDIRPNNSMDMEYYILDDICLTDSVKGTARTYTSEVSSELKEVKADVENGLKDLLNVTPKVTYMPEYNPKSSATGTNQWSNIKALTYDGVQIRGKNTKVFAYIGYPEGASSTSKAPAVVLVHGGGGHAFAEWVKRWTDKGYVAIAMDNTGYFPSSTGKGLAGRESDPANYWTYGLSGAFKENGYINAPNNSSMNDAGSEAERQWMYNAVAQVILAHNILRADDKVDSSKIGITGVSWGGVITSLTIGYDTRWAFAIPIYGSGYLDEALSWMKTHFGTTESKEIWMAQDRFDKVNFPVLWLCWNSDTAFSVNSNSKSYLDTKKNNKTALSMINGMGHSHTASWLQPICYQYADWIVKNGKGLPTLKNEPSGRNISVELGNTADTTKITAKIYYITEKMTYSLKDGNWSTTMDQVWKTVSCTVSGNKITGTVPANAYSYYVEITSTVSGKNYVTTSSYVELG